MNQDDRKALERADSADAILRHPLIAEALDHYEQELTQAWRNSKPKDATGREEMHRMLLAAAHFRAYLQATLDNGKVIQAKVRQQTLMEKARDRLAQFQRAA